MSQEHSITRPSLGEMDLQQLAAWNATEQPYPRAACVHQLVAARAMTTPDALAVAAGDQALSYRELNRRANRLAHTLQRLGVCPDVLVGLCVERSLDLVVGMLGILKAGGAYVPLDPAYPPERLAFMVRDAQMPVLLTRQPWVTQLLIANPGVTCLDADASRLGEQGEMEPPYLATADDLAYVIYTSGSTGQPKGVQITHASLLNLTFWHQRAFEVIGADRATQLASPAFDATGWELWPYLTAGASVHLPDEQTRIAPAALRDWLVAQGITISFLPTALAESVLALDWPAATKLRFLLTGADTLQRYPPPGLPFALINNYGPTEATVLVTSGRVFPTTNPQRPPSLGRPIANTQTYILDEQLQPVPIGSPGELYLGGAGLARGYLHRPELTAERFIPHPFSAVPGARLYKTGDRACYLPDGQIAFLGRSDAQIKIRGYRIEPAEIAFLLNQHPAIQSSLVLAHEDALGEKRLIAYIVLAPGAQVSVSALQAHLRAHLPDYMLPAAFIPLKALPATANGKVDRAALPPPDEAHALREEGMPAPGTPTEARVAEIVASLLKLEYVGVDENFFMLGGHSLLGTQVIARVADTFGVELALHTLFTAPTVRLLAVEIERSLLANLELLSDEEAERLLESAFGQ